MQLKKQARKRRALSGIDGLLKLAADRRYSMTTTRKPDGGLRVTFKEVWPK